MFVIELAPALTRRKRNGERVRKERYTEKNMASIMEWYSEYGPLEMLCTHFTTSIRNKIMVATCELKNSAMPIRGAMFKTPDDDGNHPMRLGRYLWFVDFDIVDFTIT